MADEETRYGPIAERLRAYYRKRGVVPQGSDYQLVQEALRSEATPKKNIDIINRATGIDDVGMGTSFLKGVGRGLGLDLVSAGVDAVAGTNTKSYLEDPSDNVWSGVAGNLVGGIAGLLTPTGLAGLGVKGAGTAAKVGRALIGTPTRALATRSATAGWQGASQGIGVQRDQQERGQRTSLDPWAIGAQGVISGGAFGLGEKWLKPLAGMKGPARRRAARLIGGESVINTGLEDLSNNTASVTAEGRDELDFGAMDYARAAGLGGALGGALGPRMAKGAAEDHEFFEKIGGMLSRKRSTPPPAAPTPTPPAQPPARTVQSPQEIFSSVGQKRQRVVPPSAPSDAPIPSSADELSWMSFDDEQPFLPGMEPPRAAPPTPPSTPASLEVDEFYIDPGKTSILEGQENLQVKDLLSTLRGEPVKKVRSYVTMAKVNGADTQVTVVEGKNGLRRFIDQTTGEIYQDGDVDFHPTKQPRWFKEWDGMYDLTVPAGVDMGVLPGGAMGAMHGVELQGGGTASLIGRPVQDDPLNPTYFAKITNNGQVGYGRVSRGDMSDAAKMKLDQAIEEAKAKAAGLNRREVAAEIQPLKPAETPIDTEENYRQILEIVLERRPDLLPQLLQRRPNR